MYILTMENAAREFADAADVSGEEFPGLDSGVDRERFRRFYRIMCAEKPEDISDISAEEILDLWGHTREYARYFKTGQKPCSMQEFTKAHSVLKRRVL